MHIAVIVDREGNVTSLEKGGKIDLYEVNADSATVLRSKEYATVANQGAAAVRASLVELHQWLTDCKIIVSNELKGIYFMMLEGFGLSMWHMTGNPADFLNYIYQQETLEQQKIQQPKNVTPENRGGGVFFVDLEQVQKEDSLISSKQVLMAFLRKKEFKVLEVKCSHAPRWFDSELPLLSLKAKTEKQVDGYLISITQEN